MSRCRACGETIVWIRTTNGKNMPCDEEPVEYWSDESGNTNLVTNEGKVVRCSLTGNGAPSGTARVPHWATCEFAVRFRR